MGAANFGFNPGLTMMAIRGIKSGGGGGSQKPDKEPDKKTHWWSIAAVILCLAIMVAGIVLAALV